MTFTLKVKAHLASMNSSEQHLQRPSWLSVDPSLMCPSSWGAAASSEQPHRL